MNLDNAIAYDIEVYPNCFTFGMQYLNLPYKAVWEISEFRDDREGLFEFFKYLCSTQTPMIGFNSLHYDYPIIHEFWNNPRITFSSIYQKSMAILEGNDRFTHIVWESDRFAPQIDLFKIHHFDNKAKSTNLKALQINMRSENVMDMPIEPGTVLTKQQIDNLLVPYNMSDVSKTVEFAFHSMEAIKFRTSLIDKFGLEVMNWNDTKIGEQTVIQRLGTDICYDTSSGRKQTRQTVRTQIALREIIFPYVRFENPEFKRVHDYMNCQVLRSEEIDQFGDEKPTIKTKGVFTDLTANVGGIEFHYGVGGIHGSVEKQQIHSTDEWLIRDIDVAALYPSIAIVNNLAPEHLGKAFVHVYSELPKERKKWQAEKGKKCVEANTLKLASNGVYGKSNSLFSPFYDPKFTMTITVNGQLLLSMLIEKLVHIPTLKIIQANTDGVTYYIHTSMIDAVKKVEREWQDLTQLVLEDTLYERMFIRDVNNYIAISKDGAVKLKGAYWYPDPMDYSGSISNAQPSAWYKNLSNTISIRAAVFQMVHGIPVEQFIKSATNPYDFCCAIKVRKSDKLFCGQNLQQRNSRYYISRVGEDMLKIAPPKGIEGTFKRAPGISESEYNRIMRETNGQWDVRVCTKNKSKYESTRTSIVAGYKIKMCNNIKDFSFSDVDYDWYINEAKKLLI